MITVELTDAERIMLGESLRLYAQLQRWIITSLHASRQERLDATERHDIAMLLGPKLAKPLTPEQEARIRKVIEVVTEP